MNCLRSVNTGVDQRGSDTTWQDQQGVAGVQYGSFIRQLLFLVLISPGSHESVLAAHLVYALNLMWLDLIIFLFWFTSVPGEDDNLKEYICTQLYKEGFALSWGDPTVSMKASCMIQNTAMGLD